MSLRDLLYVKAGGSGGGGSDTFIINVDETTIIADKTWLEIATALGEGKRVVAMQIDHANNDTNQLVVLHAECKTASLYRIWFLSLDIENEQVITFSLNTTSENGYPGDAK